MTSTSPTPNAFSCMSYFPGISKLVLLTSTNYVMQTFGFSGNNWSLLTTGANNPLPATVGSAMAYDNVADIITFGGKGLPDTYLSDATNQLSSSLTWFEATPADGYDNNLTGRSNMYLATLTGGVYLWGGVSSDNVIHNDTWLYTNASGAWSPVITASAPPARLGASCASNGTSQMLIGFGAGTGWLYNDFWLFNGTTWVNVLPNFAVGNPLARKNACMAWNPNTSSYIVFGGEDSSGNLLSDTFSITISGSVATITKLSLTNNPSVRSGACMAYNTTSSQLILTSGRNSAQLLSDTFSFINTTVGWVQL